jgi:hypothetical protein
VVANRQAINDTRGRIAELLAKAIDKGALDQELSKEEREGMRQFLAFYGELNDKGEYEPQGRSGYTVLPGGYTEAGTTQPPMRLKDLMEQRAWGLPLMFEEFFDQQSPMFQPVGGMDRIAHALYERGEAGGAAQEPGDRDQAAAARSHRPRPRPSGARRRLLHLHLAAEPARPDPERLLAGQAGGDPKDIDLLPSVKVGFESRASGRMRGFTAGSAGPTR